MIGLLAIASVLSVIATLALIGILVVWFLVAEMNAQVIFHTICNLFRSVRFLMILEIHSVVVR